MAQRAVLDENCFPSGHVGLLGTEHPRQREAREEGYYD